MLKSRLLRKLGSTKSHSLLTLTANPGAFPSRIAAFEHMSLAVGLLFKRIKTRIAPAGIEYFLVWEVTRSGWPHAHLLLRGPYLPQKWLSRQWQELAGSPIVDIRALHSKAGAARYIAKYLTKNPQVPPGFKRYRCSRGFFERLPPHPPFADFPRMTWHRQAVSTTDLAEAWRRDGLDVVTWWDGIVQAHRPSLPPVAIRAPPPTSGLRRPTPQSGPAALLFV